MKLAIAYGRTICQCTFTGSGISLISLSDDEKATYFEVKVGPGHMRIR